MTENEHSAEPRDAKHAAEQTYRHRVTSRRADRPHDGLREDNEPVVDRYSARAAHDAICDDEGIDA